MSKFYVGNDGNIDKICWLNSDGEEEQVYVDHGCITIRDSEEKEVDLYIQDIPKLILALNKAKELGWWKGV